MRRILSLLVVFVFVVGFSGITEVEAAEPTLAQCQGEPSKGTGWGTFWMIYGGLNTVAGVATILAASSLSDDDDDYYYEDDGWDEGTIRTIGIVNTVIGGGLMGLGISMRGSANSYNETCSNLLSYKRLEQGFGLEPIAKEATGVKLVYRW